MHISYTISLRVSYTISLRVESRFVSPGGQTEGQRVSLFSSPVKPVWEL